MDYIIIYAYALIEYVTYPFTAILHKNVLMLIVREFLFA